MDSQEFDIFKDLNDFLKQPEDETWADKDFTSSPQIEFAESTISKKNSPKPTKKSKRNTKKDKPVEKPTQIEDVITIEDNAIHTPAPMTRKVRTQLNKLRKELQEICGDNYNLIDDEPLSTKNKTAARKNTRRKCNIPPIATIYLDTEPSPSISSTIDLVDSDIECDSSFNSDDYEISIKIKWIGKIERFKHLQHQKFSTIINTLAQRENEDPNYVILNLDDKIISPDDTPHSIGYTISKFIHGRIVKSHSNLYANLIEIKIQTETLKRPIILKISKLTTMNEVLIMCSEELHLNPKKIKLKFDGELLDLNFTAAELELEGGEILDCVLGD